MLWLDYFFDKVGNQLAIEAVGWGHGGFQCADSEKQPINLFVNVTNKGLAN
jgi:hypothetical protein